MPSPSGSLLDAIDRTLREARGLHAAVERALRDARHAVARSPYGRLIREPRDPRDPERGSLARVLRRGRLGAAGDKKREAQSNGRRGAAP